MASLCLRIYPYRLTLYAFISQYFCMSDTHRSSRLCRRTNPLISYWSIPNSRTSILVFRTPCSLSPGVYIHDALITLHKRIAS